MGARIQDVTRLDASARTWIARAATIIRDGGLVAFPTETVYGLGGDALDTRAIARIFTAKGRPTSHPLIAHVLGADDARALASTWPETASRLAEAFWPGPLTLIVSRASHVPVELTGGTDGVAIRSPSHPVARALIAAAARPIAAPSANRYQGISPTRAEHVASSLGALVDLILDGGPCSGGIESTVVDVRNKVPVVLRLGALDLPTLAIVEPSIVDLTLETLGEADAHPSPGMDHRHYAPRTPLIVAMNRAAALEEAGRRGHRGEPVGLLLLEPLAPTDSARMRPSTMVRSLGADVGAYGHALYATLHELDAVLNMHHASLIVVEPVPDDHAWRAIADRLKRASHRA